MIAGTGYSVFLCGNRETNGKVHIAYGVLEEFEITKRLGKMPIPVGATGHATRQIWEEVMGNLNAFYPGHDVKDELTVLGDETANDEQIITAIFNIIRKTSSK
jgi:hypothetical protein